MIILVLAFGSLVAAGLPLMLTMLGLLASAGSLFLATRLLDVSIWAMNFALMFALALGIDYALFIVMRFRGAYFGTSRSAVDAVAVTMDTAGKAVLFSGMTVLISLTAVMLVPSPAFRSMSLGIMLAVAFILAATLTLLPAVLAKLGPRVDGVSLPWLRSGQQRSARFAGWGERLWRHPGAYGAAALVVLLALAFPLLQLQTGMPSIKVVPSGDQLARRLRPDPAGVRDRRTRRVAARGRARPGADGRGDRAPRRGDRERAPRDPRQRRRRPRPGGPHRRPVRTRRRRDDRAAPRPAAGGRPRRRRGR